MWFRLPYPGAAGVGVRKASAGDSREMTVCTPVLSILQSICSNPAYHE